MMPGRLLNLVARASPPHSSASSINESVAPAPSKKQRVHNYRERHIESLPRPGVHRSSSSSSPERRLSSTMDHLLHLNKDKDRETPRKDKRQSLSLNPAKRASSGTRDGHNSPRNSSPRLSSPKMGPVLPAKMEVILESPPLVFYGSTQNSSGALLSGRLKLLVTDPEITLQRFNMRLQAIVTEKKPVVKDCPDCQSQKSVVKEWNFLTGPLKLTAGTHQYPFSHLLPGHLPATTRASLGNLEYSLSARAVTSMADEILLTHPLLIQRAIIPGNDKSSIRIFPPTNLTGRIVLPPVIYPIGSFPINMTLSGIVDKAKDTQTRWRLRKLSWRIEENQKLVSPACDRHCHKLGGPGKGIEHQNVRTIGQEELKGGWKTDWDTAGGEIAMEFTAGINSALSPVCDVESPAGMEVTHNLVIELIVAEEYCPNKNTRLVTPTGAARVLRMQFKVFVTERSGLGISWDEEMPPVYSDVPASPPNYHNTTIEDYGGPPLEYEELERLDRASPIIRPTQPPINGASEATPQSPHLRSAPRTVALNVNDLEIAPEFRERRPDDAPLDPEDRQMLS